MSETRRIIIANFKQLVFNQYWKKQPITNVLQVHYIKNILRYIGRIHDWCDSLNYNFNVLYQEPLYQLLSIVDDDTRIFEFIGILNLQKRDFFIYLLTIPQKKMQRFTIRQNILQKMNVGTIHFYHICFRELFLEKKYAKGLLFSTFSDEMKKHFVNIASIEDEIEFFDSYSKLVNSPNYNLSTYLRKFVFSIHDEQFI